MLSEERHRAIVSAIRRSGAATVAALSADLQVSEATIRRDLDVLAEQGHQGAQALATYFVGQGVGLMREEKPARQVVLDFIADYLAAAERMAATLPQ